MSRILLDVFGGDNSPLEVVRGAILARRENPNLDLSFVGNKKKIFETAEKNNIDLDDVNIIDCESEITNNDHPLEIVETKKHSSMVVGLSCLANGEYDIFVSAGNSGALLIGASLIVKRAPDIRRIAFAPLIPKLSGHFLLVDAGANPNCTPELLSQFATSGSDYLKTSFKITSPKVALLNIGFESHKGDNLHKEAFELLNNSDINFVGNIEPDQVFFSDCDVVVADGFCGNIFIKTIEGTIKTLMALLKKDKNILEFIENSDHIFLNPRKFAESSYSILLGASHPVIKLHSSTSSFGVQNFLRKLSNLSFED